MSKTRFLKSVVTTAKSTKADCPWQRGEVRAANAAKRKSVTLRLKRA